MGKLTVGGREFDVLPASVLVYKTITLAAKTFDDALEAGDLSAALDAVVGAVHVALLPTNAGLTVAEVEALVPAQPGEAVGLFPALVAAVGLQQKERDQGEAASR